MYNKITVAQARAGKKVNQQAVAEYLGLSITGYRNKESGKTEFTVKEAEMLCKYFDLPFDAFSFGSDGAEKWNNNGTEN